MTPEILYKATDMLWHMGPVLLVFFGACLFAVLDTNQKGSGFILQLAGILWQLARFKQ